MQTINEYLSSITQAQKAEFERIRKIVYEMVPDAEETISYGIPTFKYKGTYLLYFGAFKNHMSLFPGSGIIGELAEDFKGYKVAKGTVQFTSEKPVPDHLVKKILSIRLKSISQK
jgi:uncharacterized protein YdhG (YjbR/CyaY superfamily)